ncbi:ABC-three component system protein [Polyangium jinanense]|uniref:ABC-three component systems C-terminal domain-containing protein n=1 Tax=Polyangium jinanense TaxID=2829994 RepID=A0A9X3X821_9BACT|nr:ABC-three component system protein [Polyangium jinanense]MDC3985932.1 hypothetical protein [Polyangium jinanense]
MEHLDDVSISGLEGNVLIQVKNEAKPLGDLNVGFWNTLANWASVSDDDSIREFVFATTAAQIVGNIPRALSIEGSSPRLKYFRRHLDPLSSEDTSVNDDIEIVKALPDARLCHLLERMRIEQPGSAKALLAKTKNALRWDKVFPERALASAAREFGGWFHLTVLEALDNKRGARIHAGEVLDRLEKIRNRFAGEGRVYQFGNAAVSQDERAACHDRLFVQQLKSIELPTMALDDALVDFLREQRERAEWAHDLTVLREDLARFDDELLDRWRHNHRDVAQRRSQVDEKWNGRQLYDDLMDKPPPELGREVPPQYVYRGSYHRLADAPRIGWHPRWEEMFGALSDDEHVTAPDSEPSDE